MKKYLIALMLLVTCIFCFVLSPIDAQAAEIVASGKCGDNLTWTLTDVGVLTISGTGAMRDYENIGLADFIIDEIYGSTAPWFFEVKNPKRISVVAVVIENGVTSIGAWAFSGLLNLESISVPDSITDIGDHAFYGCWSLTEMNLPNNIISISEYAFSDCFDLTEINLPNRITSISDYAFCGCESLRMITIPEGVTTIGEGAFKMFGGASDGMSLSCVRIPGSVVSIGKDAFLHCDKLVVVDYTGTAEQWNQINIDRGNEELTNAYQPSHQWSEVTTEPTYTAMGDKAYICAECGEKHIIETIPAKFYGTSINLGNTLDMYFGFYTGLVDENGTVKFVREFADGTTETTEAPITAFNKNNSVYDITYTGLAAKEMCDTIHVYVYNSEGVLVGQHSDSIRSYVLRQLREKDYGAEFRTLCVDLLNYGAAAQVEFGYNADDLANKDLTNEELAKGTQTVGAYTDKQTIIGQATSYYGTAYILETQISMAMAVRADRIGADCYALVSYTDHTGAEKKDIRVEGKLNYSVYEFILNEIVVADGRCLLTIDFYKADGTKVLTVQDSMESYTARNAADYPLAEKMLAFSDSAYNYLHRNDK